jgi:hypothetical protein
MSDDLVKRLRRASYSAYACQGCDDSEREEAADRIEELKRQLSLVNNSLEVWMEFSQAIFQQTSKVLGDKND